MRQAGALMLRSPLSFAVLLVGTALLSLPGLILAVAALEIDAGFLAAWVILDIVSVPLMVFPLGIMAVLLLKEDIGRATTWGDLWPALRSAGGVIFAVNALLLAFSAWLSMGSNPAVEEASKSALSSQTNFLLLLATAGKTATESTIIAYAIYSPFLLSGMICTGASRSEISTNEAASAPSRMISQSFGGR